MSKDSIIEVQHSSDHDHDGKWFEVERAPLPEGGEPLRRHNTWLNKRHATFQKNYRGRPTRIREVDAAPATGLDEDHTGIYGVNYGDRSVKRSHRAEGRNYVD